MWAFCRKCTEYAEFWGHSSVGRAPALQAGGRQFESDWLHHTSPRLRVAGHRSAGVSSIKLKYKIRQRG